MTIEERVKLAEEKHHSGYNCAQAVLCSYSDKLGIDEETLFRLSEGFGAGMADMQGTDVYKRQDLFQWQSLPVL